MSHSTEFHLTMRSVMGISSATVSRGWVVWGSPTRPSAWQCVPRYDHPPYAAQVATLVRSLTQEDLLRLLQSSSAHLAEPLSLSMNFSSEGQASPLSSLPGQLRWGRAGGAG